MNNILNAKLKETKLINESYISNFVKKIYLHDKLKNINKKFTSNKTKRVLIENELKELQDKIKKLQKFFSMHFIGQTYFFIDGAQLWLIFQPLCYTLGLRLE